MVRFVLVIRQGSLAGRYMSLNAYLGIRLSEGRGKRKTAHLRITARMCIGAPSGRLGLRGAAARRSATQPRGPVGLGATSHTRRTLSDIALLRICTIIPMLDTIWDGRPVALPYLEVY